MIGILTFAMLVATQDSASPDQQARPWREINVTSDSTPGWLPSEELEATARKTAETFFSLVDQGRDQDAYILLAPRMREMLPFSDFAKANNQFRKTAGELKRRNYLKLTWTKDPANAPAKGVYAALDESALYDRVDRQCGHIILYQPPEGGSFQVMRTENNFIDNASARDIESNQSPTALESLWSQLAANCPNFQTSQ
jgi:hypothetical protein